MIRYPESERRAIANINSMYIRTRDGAEVPFSTVATYRVETGYQSIERLDRLRTLEVSADVSEDGHRRELLWSRYFETTDLSGCNGILVDHQYGRRASGGDRVSAGNGLHGLALNADYLRVNGDCV